VGLAGVSSLADRARANRTNPDAVGFMPWAMILILSLIGAVVVAAIALKS
jgi:hypothetical protein